MVKSRACSSHVGQLGKRPPRTARGAEAVSSSGSRFGVALVQTQRHLGPMRERAHRRTNTADPASERTPYTARPRRCVAAELVRACVGLARGEDALRDRSAGRWASDHDSASSHRPWRSARKEPPPTEATRPCEASDPGRDRLVRSRMGVVDHQVGLRAFPLSSEPSGRSSKCRCGPVDSPVFPVRAMTCPATTVAPAW